MKKPHIVHPNFNPSGGVRMEVSRQAKDYLRSRNLEGFLDNLKETLELAGVSYAYVGRNGESLRINVVFPCAEGRS